MDFIEVQHAVKCYGSHTALDDVSVNVPQGCIYGLLGPNGAGKTTLIRIINQIIKADSGKVFFNGNEMTESDVRQIGYLPEERGLYKKMKVADHIVYRGQLKGMPRAQAKEECAMWLRRFNLEKWAAKTIQSLSKGMAQKVQFISTVIHRPKLLIFDEPFSGFDPVNAEILKNEILALRNDGSTILFSTHNMASVEEVCQRISLINKSRVVLEGEVNDVRQRFKKNIISVELNDDVLAPNENLYEIQNINERPAGGVEVVVRLKDGVSVRDAIATLNSEYSLLGFHEILPSMHEIFIETVS